jgi:hypothetical protein
MMAKLERMFEKIRQEGGAELLRGAIATKIQNTLGVEQ